MTNLVTYTLNDKVATIAMDDGKVNVLSLQMQTEINAALDRAEADNACVLITGRAGSFSAGFDVATLMAGGQDAYDMLVGGFKLSERVLAHPRPVVAAVSGHCLAMGLFLALSADYIIAADGKFKVGANEVAIGLTMPHTAIEVCKNRMTPACFARAMMTSEIVLPKDAIAGGMIDRVVEPDSLADEASATAATLAALHPTAYKGTKQRVRADVLERIGPAIETDSTEFRAMFKLG